MAKTKRRIYACGHLPKRNHLKQSLLISIAIAEWSFRMKNCFACSMLKTIKDSVSPMVDFK